jgi:hypothetical protein
MALPGLDDLKIVLKDSTKGLFEKVTSIAKTVDKLAGGVGTALKSNIEWESVSKAIEEVDTKAHEIVRIFGQGKENILAIKANLVDSIPAVTKLGGSFSDIAGMQKDISNSLGRNLIVNSNIYEKLYATTKVTGQGADSLTTAFKDIGMSVSHISDEMKKVSDVSRGLGVNTQKVSSQVVTNMETMNRLNFQGGVEGMAKMAAQAVSLRVSMKDTLNFAERVYNPENAIETSAALQRLGVAQSELLDPLRLMDLSLNDPTELQNQLAQMTKQFVQMNEAGQFEIMPEGKLQLYEISRALQMPYETLTKMALGGAELEEKMKNIRFPEGEKFADPKTRQLIANLAELDKDTGEFMISFSDKDGVAQKKAVTELDPDDIEQLAKASEPKEMIDLAKQQLTASEAIVAEIKSLKDVVGYGYAASPVTQKMLDAQVEIYRTAISNISDKFSVKGFRELFTKTGNEVLKVIDKADGDVTKIDTDKLKEQLQIVKDYIIDLGNETITTGLEKTTESFKKSANEFVEFLGKADLNLEKLKEKLEIVFGKGEDDDDETGGEERESGKGGEERQSGKGGGERQSGKGGQKDVKKCNEDKDCGDVKQYFCDSEKRCRVRTEDLNETEDLVSFPGSDGRVLTGEFGAFSLDDKDMIIAGDPNKIGNSQKDVSGFIENLLRNQQMSSMNGNIKIDGNPRITLDININSPQNITKDEMMNYLEDKGVANVIYNQMQELMSNSNRTVDYTNPTEKNKKLTNDQYASMMGY